jgi:RNase P/RNase MRP subunit POP5
MVTTVLVSDAEKALLESAQERIMQCGLGALDPIVIEELKEANVDIIRFTRGTIVAIGAACILAKLKNNKK